MAGVANMKQITLEKWIAGQSDAANRGSNVNDRQAIYNIYADVRRRGGYRTTERNQTQLSSTYEFRVWWRPELEELTALWKIKYDGKAFTVHTIERIDEKKFNYLITAESVGNPRL